MADDTRKSPRSSRRTTGGTTRGSSPGRAAGAGGTSGAPRARGGAAGARDAGAASGGAARGARPAAARDEDLDALRDAGGGPGAGALDDTPPASAGLGGATGDGDGLTNAALTAAHLADDDVLEGASEPVIVATRVTVLTEVPVDANGEPIVDSIVDPIVDPQADAGDGGTDPDAVAALPDGPIDDQQRWLMIAELAYLHAAQRDFAPGRELDDWLAAEREVDARIAARAASG